MSSFGVTGQNWKESAGRFALRTHTWHGCVLMLLSATSDSAVPLPDLGEGEVPCGDQGSGEALSGPSWRQSQSANWKRCSKGEGPRMKLWLNSNELLDNSHLRTYEGRKTMLAWRNLWNLRQCASTDMWTVSILCPWWEINVNHRKRKSDKH